MCVERNFRSVPSGSPEGWERSTASARRLRDKLQLNFTFINSLHGEVPGFMFCFIPALLRLILGYRLLNPLLFVWNSCQFTDLRIRVLLLASSLSAASIVSTGCQLLYTSVAGMSQNNLNELLVLLMKPGNFAEFFCCQQTCSIFWAIRLAKKRFFPKFPFQSV